MENLSGFDPATMTYFATQMAQPNMSSNPDLFAPDALLPMDLPDHHSAYGYEGYDLPQLQACIISLLTVRA